MTLTSSASSVEINKNIHVDGLLKYRSGISGASVSLKVTLPDGSVKVPVQGATTITNSSGMFAMDYVPTLTGVYEFTATYSGNYRYTSSSASASVNVTSSADPAPQPVRWTWIQSPASGVVGQSSVYSVKFEVQYTSGSWFGARTTGITYTFTSPSGVVKTLSTSTPADTTGISSVTLVPDATGTWTVKCNWDQNNAIYAWDSSPVKTTSVSSASVTPTKVNTSIALSGPTSVQTGVAGTVTGTLKTNSGTAISGATVSVQVTNPDGSKAAAVTKTTDASGAFTFSVTPTVVGSYTVTVTYAGSTNYNGIASSVSFTASAPSSGSTTGYNYIISGTQVKTSSGTVAYQGSSFTAALKWAASQAGKITYIPAGTYDVTSYVEVATGVTIYGAGPGTTGTVLHFTTGTQETMCLTGVDNVVLKQFRLTGSGNICIRSPTTAVAGKSSMGNILIQDVTIYGTSVSSGYLGGGFWTYARPTMNIDGLKFIRCQALYVNSFGFCIQGNDVWNGVDTMQTLRAKNVWVRNIYMEDCVADHCGVNGRPNNYICGFNLEEGANVENVNLVRCVATYNWMNGFHWEGTLYAKNCVLTDCEASYNGVGKVSNGANAGFFWYGGSPYYNEVTLIGCTGHNNYGPDADDSHTHMELLPSG